MTDAVMVVAVLVLGGFIGAFAALFLFTRPEDKEARAALSILTPKVRELERTVKWLLKNHVTANIGGAVEDSYQKAKQH